LNIGIENEGRLYWNGHMVKEANPLELTSVWDLCL